MRSRRSSVGAFLAMKLRYQGPKGRKVQNQARKMGKKIKQKTKAEQLVRERPLGTGRELGANGTCEARTWLCSFLSLSGF